MGRTGLKSPTFALRRVSSHVRVRSQSFQVECDFEGVNKFVSGVEGGDGLGGRRIMVVVDSGVEAKCALQWTLSHTVLDQDTIVLVYVCRTSKQGKKISKKSSQRVYELLHSMKTFCLMKRPEVQVEMTMVEGREKGPSIVKEAKKQEASILVLGQRKRSAMWRAVMMWRRNRMGSGVVEYCIQNANCMTVAVRKKRRTGGYLITTRQHKDFWLLA